jgi:hypothetical protein
MTLAMLMDDSFIPEFIVARCPFWVVLFKMRPVLAEVLIDRCAADTGQVE